jgi:ParB family chromosome partitioning protein
MVTKKHKGLGMGLEALLGPAAVAAPAAADNGDGEPRTLALEEMQPGRYQPRTRMDESGLQELAESIRVQGVMQPVLVRRLHGSGNGAATFEIIAGERRVRAARLAGLARVPVLVRDVTDEAAAAMALIENMQREDLNPLEEARGLQRLTEEFGMTHDAAARSVGRSRSATTNLLRLLQLSAPVQEMLMSGALEMGHARALLPLGGAEQIQAANEIVAKGLSVREAEALAARRAAGSARRSPLPRGGRAKSADILRLERQLADTLAAPVEIRMRTTGPGKAERGEIAIGFASFDELDGLLSKLGHERA